MKYVDCDIMFQEVPDEVSLVVNVSNCPNKCPGCHSSYLMNDIGYVLDTDSMEKLISPYENLITCVCFMGGDSSPYEVEDLARWINMKYEGRYIVAWYSGRDNIPEGFDITQFRYIKTGRYIEKLGNLRCRTTNQRFYEIGKDRKMNDRTEMFWR